jgi:23S rRNA (adenine2503-C2)-methyltransferase
VIYLKVNLFGLFKETMEQLITVHGLEKYRAEQIAKWMYQRGITDFSLMTDLSKRHHEILNKHFCITIPSLITHYDSDDGKTSKFLLGFEDGAAVETVLMRHHYGNSVCISTQVGCAMGCLFCASTLNGMVRNLSAGEILAQIIFINNILYTTNEKVDTIVIMGSGEPLANYQNVLAFIRLCHEKYCLNLSYRSITLSTSGLVNGIDKLAAEGLPINLSISLHAPNDTLRSKLMPVNKTYPIDEVIAAGDRYAAATGRRVTYEYILISGINDQKEQAGELAELMQGRLASVNLIPVNAVPERGLLRPSPESILKFEQYLKIRHINVTVRREMGADIQASCGQLRHKVLTEGR